MIGNLGFYTRICIFILKASKVLLFFSSTRKFDNIVNFKASEARYILYFKMLLCVFNVYMLQYTQYAQTINILIPVYIFGVMNYMCQTFSAVNYFNINSNLDTIMFDFESPPYNFINMIKKNKIA